MAVSQGEKERMY